MMRIVDIIKAFLSGETMKPEEQEHDHVDPVLEKFPA